MTPEQIKQAKGLLEELEALRGIRNKIITEGAKLQLCALDAMETMHHDTTIGAYVAMPLLQRAIDDTVEHLTRLGVEMPS